MSSAVLVRLALIRSFMEGQGGLREWCRIYMQLAMPIMSCVAKHCESCAHDGQEERQKSAVQYTAVHATALSRENGHAPAAQLSRRPHELGLWQVHRPQLRPILLPWRKCPSSHKGCGGI